MKNNIIVYIQKVLKITNEDLSKFFGVSQRTIYNVRTFDNSKIPRKALSKIFMFFGFETYSTVKKYLDSLDENELEKERQRFLDYSNKMNPMHNISVDYKENITSKDTEKSNIDEILSRVLNDMKPVLLIKSKKVSRGYVSLLSELINRNLENGNDYGLLDYLEKYRKKGE